jgi:hypothetical protein
MASLWLFHRKLVIMSAVIIVVVIGAATLAVGASGHKAGRTTTPPIAADRPTSPKSPTTKHGAGTTTAPTTPLRVTPPATQIQSAIDSQLARSESPASIAQTEHETVPTPGTSTSYPAVSPTALTDPTAFALAFSQELLDVNYRKQSRPALLAWAQYEEAPDTLPGVPAQIGDKSLIGSLAYGGVAGATATPVPTAPAWGTLSSGTVQRVSSLGASVAPDWTSLVAQGWEPTDPLMTIMTVTGTVTTTGPGQSGFPRSFSMALTLGGARHHSGYGAVAVSAWTEV